MAGGIGGESGLRDTGIAIQDERDLVMYFGVCGSASDINVSPRAAYFRLRKRRQDFPQPLAN